MPKFSAFPWPRFACALLFPALLFFLHHKTLSYLGDTDRYYHFALSKQLSETRSLRIDKLPQAGNLGWGDYFPDKEFLFHTLTSAAYALAGEQGVSVAVLLVAAGSACILYFYALGSLSIPLALAAAFASFFSHGLVFRMLLVRPHVLALFCFLLLQFALLRKKPVLCFFATAAYVLAYHALYIPLICLGLAAVLALAEPKDKRRDWWNLIGLGLAGFCVGILVNPYFPANIQMGVMVARIPFLMQGVLKSARFGLELYPLGAPGMLKFYALQFVVMAFALFGYGRTVGWLKVPGNFANRYLIALTFFFGLLSFQTVRAGEYFIPLAGLLMIQVLGGMRPLWQRRYVLTFAVLQLLILVKVARTEAAFIPDADSSESTWNAIAAIPSGPAKVFNCEWDSSAFLLYARPDLRFVDLLDPSLLFQYEPGLYAAKTELESGAISDPRGVISGLFKSDYVLCRNRALADQLAGDGAFQQLYPAAGQKSGVYLFKVAAEPAPAFVRKFGIKLVEGNLDAALAFTPALREKLNEVVLPGTFVQALGLRELRGPGLSCAHLRAAESEVKRLSGADFLGIGGGEAVRAWRNGKLLFSSGRGYSRALSVQSLVPLVPPLAAGDRIDLLVCSGPEARFWTAVLSLWGKAAMAKPAPGNGSIWDRLHLRNRFLPAIRIPVWGL